MPSRNEGPGWVLEVRKDLTKEPGHGSQQGSGESGQVPPFSHKAMGESFIFKVSSAEKCRQ